MECHHTPIRSVKIKKLTLNAAEDAKKMDHSYIAGRYAEWYSQSGKQRGS